jgi:DNA-binding response OmpR family regulator
LQEERHVANILVIDDDRLFAELITLHLQQRGHTVSYELDGRDGMERFKAEEFDAVICDIVMPHREGIETIREIRGRNSHVGIIAISGGLSPVPASMNVLNAAQVLGADASLKKPFALSELASIVEGVLVDRLARTRPAAS